MPSALVMAAFSFIDTTNLTIQVCDSALDVNRSTTSQVHPGGRSWERNISFLQAKRCVSQSPSPRCFQPLRRLQKSALSLLEAAQSGERASRKIRHSLLNWKQC